MATFASQTDLTIADIEEFLEATLGDIKGMDTEDREYDNIQDLWEYELKRQAESSAAVAIAGGSAQQSQWYSDAYQYWESEANCPLSGKFSVLLFLSNTSADRLLLLHFLKS